MAAAAVPPEHGGDAVVCRVKGHGITKSGACLIVDFKAQRYPDGTVYWGLRWPMAEVAKHLYVKSNFRLGHWMGQHEETHKTCFLAFGRRYEDHVIPSWCTAENNNPAKDGCSITLVQAMLWEKRARG